MELLLLSNIFNSFFTFNHLHSNMELLLPYYRYKISWGIHWFTFQYGATSTQINQLEAENQSYLHSNMELLLLYNLIITNNNIFIYIPIWSYFYWIFSFSCLNCNNIYIPIWSYFYCILPVCEDETSLFTFQYGATSTLQPFY